MEETNNKNFTGFIIGFILIAFIAGLVMVNNWLQKETSDIVAHSINTSTIKPLPSPQKKELVPKKRIGEVIRKTRLAPERTFEISVFYQGGDEIARHKVAKDMTYDNEGEIPDGRVKFINESNKTYGAEFYRGGRRHGPAKVYYRDGPLKREMEYQYGRLIKNKEYYHDETLRMEEDFTDAREYNDNREVGIGKVYFRDGTLKYEWFMVNSEPTGFNRSYDTRGRLVYEVLFDEYGQIVQSQAVPTEDAGPVSAEEISPAPDH